MNIITNTINNVSDLMEYYEDHAWSGAKDRVNTSIDNGTFRDVCFYIWESLQGVDTVTDTQLNDILWFDEVINDMIYNHDEEED